MSLSDELLKNIVTKTAELDFVRGTGGFKFLSTAAHTALTGYALVCNTDCTFTVFKVDGVDNMAKLGLTGAAVKAGTYLPVERGTQITDVTTTAGDCIIYMQ